MSETAEWALEMWSSLWLCGCREGGGTAISGMDANVCAHVGQGSLRGVAVRQVTQAEGCKSLRQRGASHSGRGVQVTPGRGVQGWI